MADEKLLAVLASVKPLTPCNLGSPPQELMVAGDWVEEHYPEILQKRVSEHLPSYLFRKAMGRESESSDYGQRTIWAACVYVVHYMFRRAHDWPSDQLV